MEPTSERLDSWKEIAVYLRRNVSTVQRWEKREGLPVHRHLHDKLGSVYALRSELDRWREGRSPSLETLPEEASDLGAPDPGHPAEVSRPSTSLGVRSLIRVALIAMVLGTVVTASWLIARRKPAADYPLSDAKFSLITDFEGTEHSATISRDGQFIAFLSDRDGPMDVWVTRVGSGQFHNLTHGGLSEVVNPSIRNLAFSPDGTLVLAWVRKPDGSSGSEIGVWGIPTLGGPARPYLEGVAELDWSKDGSRLAYHTPGPGDPLFVKSGNDPEARQIFMASAGRHAHFPIWSADGALIYFVGGILPDKLDIWAIRPAGGPPEQITFRNARVSHPTPLGRRWLLYLATAEDGSGPWLHSLDLETHNSRRAVFGVERYLSLAADAEGHRLVATVANPKVTLWRVPLSERAADKSATIRIVLPTLGGRSPRIGAHHLLYVSSTGEGEGIWKLAEGKGTELWNGRGARVVGGPAISPDGRRVAFCTEKDRGRGYLEVMNDDGTNLRALSGELEFRGSPAWAPDGKTLVVASNGSGGPQLFSISLDGGPPVPLGSEYAMEPVWAPDGGVLVYSGPDVGTTFSLGGLPSDVVPSSIRRLNLTRGARRLVFVRGGRALVVLRGDIEHKDFSLVDLESGTESRLTNFGRDVVIRDFDVSPDESEIVFDRVQENSDIVLIERHDG